MFFAFREFFYAIIFFLIEELLILLEYKLNWQVYENNTAAVTLILAIALSLYSFYAIRKISRIYSPVFIGIIYSFSSIMLYYLIDSFAEKQIFFVLNSIIFYFYAIGYYRLGKYEKDETARGIIASMLMATTFLFITSFYGLYLNFAISQWIFMLTVFFCISLLNYNYFSLLIQDKKTNWLYSLSIGAAMSQIAWVINFWPFGYLTTGVIVLMLYYVFWDMTQSNFLNLLSKKRIMANIALFIVLITLVLISSRWLPAI